MNIKKLILVIFSTTLLFMIQISIAAPSIYLFLNKGPAKLYRQQLSNPKIKGAQIIYSWKSLEPKENVYDFSAINKDLKLLQSMHKYLYIQIQDRSFIPKNIPVPNYLLSKKYNYGIAMQEDFAGEGKAVSDGWVAEQWNPNVRSRFQKLLMMLGKNFNGKVAGVNLPETAIDLQVKNDNAGFTYNKYFNSILSNLKILHLSFPNSNVIQYINFIPGEWNNDHHYMSNLFKFAVKNKIGLGGPDVVPYRRGQMKNSYPFFNRYKDKLVLVAFAIQAPDYTYKNPQTNKPFTTEEIYDFANNHLGATVLFWDIAEPQYSKQVLPWLNTKYNVGV